MSYASESPSSPSRAGGPSPATRPGRALRRGPAAGKAGRPHDGCRCEDRKSTRLNSSHGYISYAVFCLKKKKKKKNHFFMRQKATKINVTSPDHNHSIQQPDYTKQYSGRQVKVITQ